MKKILCFSLAVLSSTVFISCKAEKYATGSGPAKKIENVFQAARAGDLKFIENEIARGIDINARDQHKNTVICHAAAKNHKDLLLYLIEKKADINVNGHGGRTPLIFAVNSHSTEAVKILIGAGVDLNGENNEGVSALTYAVIFGYEDIVRILIDAGADVNHQDHYQKLCALSHSSFYPDIAKMLIDAGANVNLKDIYGHTPVKYAVNNVLTLKLLLEGAAEVNYYGKDGLTPLMYAAQRCFSGICTFDKNIECTDVVKLLIEHGADIKLRNQSGKTAIDYARIKSCSDNETLLLSAINK